MNEKEIILEQYKLYVEMADRISSKRAQTNMFFITVLSGLIAIAAFIIEKKLPLDIQNIMFKSISVLGILLSVLWFFNILSYKQINKSKYDIIISIEKQLPLKGYGEEYELLEKYRYVKLTTIERIISCTMIIPFLILLFI